MKQILPLSIMSISTLLKIKKEIIKTGTMIVTMGKITITTD